MNIRSVRKYITSDGIEFNSFKSAQEHQDAIEKLGKSIKAGDAILFNNACGYDFNIGVVEEIRGSLVFLKDINWSNYSAKSFPLQTGAIHLASHKILQVVNFDDFFEVINER